MDFIMCVVETWGHSLLILLIKPEHSNYFKLNSMVGEERMKSVTRMSVLICCFCKSGGGVGDGGIHVMEPTGIVPNGTLTLSCAFGS
jgi:hypothetical protein